MIVVDGDDLSGATKLLGAAAVEMDDDGGMIMLTGLPALAPRLGRDVRLAGVGEMSADGFIDTTRALLLLLLPGVVGMEGREAVERAREVVTLRPSALLFLLLAMLAVDSERNEPAELSGAAGGRVVPGPPAIGGLLGVPSPETRRAANPGD